MPVTIFQSDQPLKRLGIAGAHGRKNKRAGFRRLSNQECCGSRLTVAGRLGTEGTCRWNR